MARRRLAAKAKRQQQRAEAAGEADGGKIDQLPFSSEANKSEPAIAVLALSASPGRAAVAAGSCLHILEER